MSKSNCLALLAVATLAAVPVLAQDKEMPSNLVRASELIGLDVKNAANENLGDVKDVVLDREKGTVAYAVVSFGGFLNMGDKLFAVPWESFKASSDHKTLVLDLPKDRLEKAPGFNKDQWPNMADAKWSNEIRTFYGAGAAPATTPRDDGMARRDDGAKRDRDVRRDQAMADGHHQIVSRSGTIRTFTRGANGQLVMTTTQGDLNADLGSVTFLDQQRLTFDNGAPITVRGYEATRDGRTTFVVTEVVSNERTIRIRQDDALAANDGARNDLVANTSYQTTATANAVAGTRDLTGTVISIESSPCEESGYGRQVRINTSDGERVVALAPGDYLDNRRWVLRPRDSVTVRGYDYDRNGNRVFIATELRRGSDTWAFRRADGTPLWVGTNR